MASPVVNLGSTNLLADAPQGILDELFAGSEAFPQTTENSTAPSSEPLQTTVPAQPVQQDFFLKSGDIAYKTADDAVRGIAHKDSIISDLRQRWIEEKGIDPITNQTVARPQVQQQPVNYLDNKEAFFDALVSAAQSGKKAEYVDALLKAVSEQVQRDVVQPFAPTINSFAQREAVAQVTSEVPEFSAFRAGTGYQEVLDSLPSLKDAIKFAEGNTAFAKELPGLYKTAYWAGLGRQSGAIAKQAATTAAATTKPVSARPTTSPGTLTPASTGGSQPSLATKAGRDAIIAQFEAANLHERPMDDFTVGRR